MNIRWRLLVLLVQLIVLSIFTYLVTGKIVSGETWFFAGLFAIIINPQLIEPFYPKPPDIIVNSLIFGYIYSRYMNSLTSIGWHILAVFIFISLIMAILGLILGTQKSKNIGISVEARRISQIASAKTIYSSIFILSAYEYYPSFIRQFWYLIGAWVVIMFLAHVNWQSIFSTIKGKAILSKIEGIIGPNLLLLSAPDLPKPGTALILNDGPPENRGIILNRIRRIDDTWGQILLFSQSECESILSKSSLKLKIIKEDQNTIIGSVDPGSTDRYLRFTATENMEIGNVVGVPLPNSNKHVIYQLSSAQVEKKDIKHGSYMVVRTISTQLGIFNTNTLRFDSHRWVPPPGAPVLARGFSEIYIDKDAPQGNLSLGYVIGTRIPIFLNCNLATEGHLAILGMTKMGKTTLADRIARELSKNRRVTILDQTGEYVNKRHYEPTDNNVDWSSPGISVFEPKPGEIPAERALSFLEYTINLAVAEYKTDSTIQRTIIIDEAHQFIPEPAGLGFNAPGRDSSFKIGLLMMQIRKYGISIILISQRTAVVAKSALSQCENMIAFRSVDQTGLDYLEAIAGSSIRNLLPQLRQGEAIVFGPAMSSDSPIGIIVPKPT